MQHITATRNAARVHEELAGDTNSTCKQKLTYSASTAESCQCTFSKEGALGTEGKGREACISLLRQRHDTQIRTNAVARYALRTSPNA